MNYPDQDQLTNLPVSSEPLVVISGGNGLELKAAEFGRRWNCHDDLLRALQQIANNAEARWWNMDAERDRASFDAFKAIHETAKAAIANGMGEMAERSFRIYPTTKPNGYKATISDRIPNAEFPYRVFYYAPGMGFDTGNLVGVGYSEFRTLEQAQVCAASWIQQHS